MFNFREGEKASLENETKLCTNDVGRGGDELLALRFLDFATELKGRVDVVEFVCL